MLSALAGLTLLLVPVSAFSQSCALCYTQAASSGSRMIQALKSGILILVAPPTLGSVGVVFVLYRKRNQVRRRDSDDEPEKDPDPGWKKSDGQDDNWRKKDW
jgi:hypothetical protein